MMLTDYENESDNYDAGTDAGTDVVNDTYDHHAVVSAGMYQAHIMHDN